MSTGGNAIPLPDPAPDATASAIHLRHAFPADLTALGPALRSVADTCRDQNVPVLTILQIELLLEELFTNSIAHGYAAAVDTAAADAVAFDPSGAKSACVSAPGRIWITLQQQSGALHITYADAAPPYNPLNASHNQFNTAPFSLEKCQVGGIGLILIQQAPFPLSYSYQDGQNRIRFIIEC